MKYLPSRSQGREGGGNTTPNRLGGVHVTGTAKVLRVGIVREGGHHLAILLARGKKVQSKKKRSIARPIHSRL